MNRPATTAKFRARPNSAVVPWTRTDTARPSARASSGLSATGAVRKTPGTSRSIASQSPSRSVVLMRLPPRSAPVSVRAALTTSRLWPSGSSASCSARSAPTPAPISITTEAIPTATPLTESAVRNQERVIARTDSRRLRLHLTAARRPVPGVPPVAPGGSRPAHRPPAPRPTRGRSSPE